ncbi:hypothetical protein, partial [Bacillus cereus group sp. BC330]|uniref:hypothetical protein n=1 Tax=Bacillus cereus group sp. BC330 TaxID=3445306 RepID=UPI003F266B06
PDVDTFIKICKWLNVSTDTFIEGNKKKKVASNYDQVIAHLRADKELSKDSVNMLIRLIDMAYNNK